jgi:cytochrome oxidase Cu insertion factor (SCO1/SenC/PrrC family)
MVVGGILILKAYEKRARETAKDDRPSFLSQISEEKDLSFVRQDGELTDLLSLEGKVIVVQSLASNQPDPLATAAMQRLSEHFKGEDDVALVTLMLDPGKPDQLKGELQALADEIGAELPQWTVASNDRPTLHKFIKNEFKANMFPYEKDGEWRYDPSLVLIDSERRVRRVVIPQKRGGAPYVGTFDFDQAAKWDVEGIKTGTTRSNVEQLEELLAQTINNLLTEKSDP